MKIKKLIIFLSAFFFLTMSACAADQAVDDLVAQMTEELTLTQAQADTVRPIIMEYASRLGELQEDLNWQDASDASFTRSRMEQLRAEEREKLAKILDPEQLKKWNNKQKMNKFLNKGGGGDAGWVPRGSSATAVSF